MPVIWRPLLVISATSLLAGGVQKKTLAALEPTEYLEALLQVLNAGADAGATAEAPTVEERNEGEQIEIGSEQDNIQGANGDSNHDEADRFSHKREQTQDQVKAETGDIDGGEQSNITNEEKAQEKGNEQKKKGKDSTEESEIPKEGTGAQEKEGKGEAPTEDKKGQDETEVADDRQESPKEDTEEKETKERQEDTQVKEEDMDDQSTQSTNYAPKESSDEERAKEKSIGDGTVDSESVSHSAGAEDVADESSRGISANMTAAAKAAGRAAELALKAKDLANKFKSAKAEARRYAEEARRAAAVLGASSARVANASLEAAAAAVEGAEETEDPGVLDVEGLRESSAEAEAAAAEAQVAAANASRAAKSYRDAEQAALDAAQSGFEVAEQIAGSIDSTMERSSAAARALADPMAEAKRFVDERASPPNTTAGTSMETTIFGTAVSTSESPSSSGVDALTTDEEEEQEERTATTTTTAGRSIFGRASQAVDRVADKVSDYLDRFPSEAEPSAKETTTPTPTRSDFAGRNWISTQFAGWIAFGALLAGIAFWCYARPHG